MPPLNIIYNFYTSSVRRHTFLPQKAIPYFQTLFICLRSSSSITILYANLCIHSTKKQATLQITCLSTGISAYKPSSAISAYTYNYQYSLLNSPALAP